ncbi:MAG: amidohydrolase [Gemmatimonadales bacterium]
MSPRLPFVAGFLLAAACARPSPTDADLVIFGRIWTGDPAAPVAAALAVRGDSIVLTGDSVAVVALVGPATEVVPAPGLVTPGLLDDHVHLFMGGFQLASVDLRDAATPEEFTRRLKTFAATLPPGEWIQGGSWDHELWPGTPLPDRSWIDSVTPNNPVFVTRLDGHMALANTAALEAARIDRSVGTVAGGEIVRRADGELTGVMKDEAQGLVGRAIPEPSPAQLDSALTRAMRHAAEKGVTGIASVSTSWSEIAAVRRARDRGALTFRVSNYTPLAGWQAAAESLRVNGPGDAWIRTAGVKGLIDGSLGSTTAYFDAPYADAPRTAGFLTIPEDSARRWILGADSAGLQLAVHAIGDRANGLVLDLFAEAAARNGPRDRRSRIEHAQHLRPRDVPRFAELGVIPSMQPYHAADDGRWAEKRIGPVRIKTTYAFRSLLAAGARLTFGSDWTVAPLDPLLGVEAAVTRRTIDGAKIFVPEERITVDQALRAYTVENAYAMYLDGVVGRLAPGLKADLVIFDRDLLTMPVDSIPAARVLRTMVGGRTVYRAP